LSYNKKLKWRVLFPFGKKIFKDKIAFLNDQIEKYENNITDKKNELSNSVISTKIPDNENIISKFSSLKKTFNTLSQSEFVWDITTSQFIDRVKIRSAASKSLERKTVNIFFSSVDLIQCDEEPFTFKMQMAVISTFIPTLIIIVTPTKEFALLDYRDIDLSYSESHFIEEEKFPKDSIQVGITWAKVNKDGSRDRRFSNNYQIPIALYGQLHWETKKGFNEVYQFSNADSAQNFYEAFLDYKSNIRPS
jgi:hypothetical protein